MQDVEWYHYQWHRHSVLNRSEDSFLLNLLANSFSQDRFDHTPMEKSHLPYWIHSVGKDGTDLLLHQLHVNQLRTQAPDSQTALHEADPFLGATTTVHTRIVRPVCALGRSHNVALTERISIFRRHKDTRDFGEFIFHLMGAHRLILQADQS